MSEGTFDILKETYKLVIKYLISFEIALKLFLLTTNTKRLSITNPLCLAKKYFLIEKFTISWIINEVSSNSPSGDSGD
jgi:hypothetical protein